MMWGDYSGGWWIVMWSSMAVFWALVIVSAVVLVNSFSRNRASDDAPEETLKRRLAAGEIDQEQYRVLSDEIHGRPHRPTAAVH